MIGGVVIAIKPWEEFTPEDGFNQQVLDDDYLWLCWSSLCNDDNGD